MRYHSYRIFQVILMMVLGVFTSTFAQTYLTQGKEFWIAYTDIGPTLPGGYTWADITITSNDTTTGTIENAGVGWVDTFTVAPPAPYTVEVPVPLRPPSADTIMNLGIHIAAKDSVTVYAAIIVGGGDGGSTVYPVESLGARYMITSWFNNDSSGFANTWIPSRAVVVALCDSTQVRVIPSQNLSSGQQAGVPFDLMLNKGDIYIFQSIYDNSQFTNPPGLNLTERDLTGTRIVSLNSPPKRFGVFSGTDATYVGSCNAGDDLYEQQLPMSRWGTEFLTSGFANGPGEITRITAGQNSTDVTINGMVVTTLSVGDYFDTVLTTPSYITTSNPAAVHQIMFGNHCGTTSQGDPELLYVHPLTEKITSAQYATKFNMPTPGPYYWTTIFTPTSSVGQLTHDGVPVPSTAFTQVPAYPGYSKADIQESPGAHIIESPAGFFGYTYGLFGNLNTGENSYAFSLGGVPLATDAIAPLKPEDLCPPGDIVAASEPSRRLSESRNPIQRHFSSVRAGQSRIIANNSTSPKTLTVYTLSGKMVAGPFRIEANREIVVTVPTTGMLMYKLE